MENLTLKQQIRSNYDLVCSIFRDFKPELPPEIQLIVKETDVKYHAYALEVNRMGGEHKRIYIKTHSLTTPRIFVTHLILHEICHHLVGIKEGHNEIFQAKEKELNLAYGIRIKGYSLKTPDGFLAYARLNDLEWISNANTYKGEIK